jgi:hypothetical protein
LASRGYGQLTVFHTFCRDQLVRNLFDERSLPPHRLYFQTVMVVQMHVKRSNDDFIVVMLDVGEGCLNVGLVVVVNERDRASNVVFTEVLLCSTKCARIMSATAWERLS